MTGSRRNRIKIDDLRSQVTPHAMHHSGKHGPLRSGRFISIYTGIMLAMGWINHSCSNTKFLAEDEKLYTYTWFSEKGFGRIKNKPLKAYELYQVGKAKTNSPVIFLPRTNLTIYNYCKPTGEWGPRHYIHRVFGKPPVLLGQVNPEFRTKVMKQRLADMGHFDSEVKLDLKIYGMDDKKARARYDILFKPAYTYRDYRFIETHKRADSIISEALPTGRIKAGNDYWLRELDDERVRLSSLLKNQGHYFFQPDHLLFFADTTIGHKQVDLSLVVKDGIPEKAYHPYQIRRVNVLVEPEESHTGKTILRDSFSNDHYHYQSFGASLRPKIITNAISIKPAGGYRLDNHENTLRYLQGMGVFKSVEISYHEIDSTNKLLDADVKLIPQKPLQTSLEFNFTTKSNDFLGPAAIASIGHRNIFKGAEHLAFQVDGGFEWQKRSKRKTYDLGLNSYELGTQLKLTIPRILVPFKIENPSSRYVPQTYTSIGFRTLRRVQYYHMNLSQIRFGYSWRSSPKLEFKLEPVSVDYLKVTESSDEFNEFLIQYPLIAKSFEEQFILGSTYGISYSNNPKKNRFNQFYYNGSLDLSGNLIDAYYTLAGSKQAGEPGVLFGVPYSQYIRLTSDVRYYRYFNEKRQIATRLLAGIGVPYRNSDVLPYVKQYFAGGSHDLRAFYARSVGPGSYFPTDSLQGRHSLDQSGEIKLLGSIEYRFPITYRTFGALFLDAGNVWLLEEDDARPGGKFETSKFLKDMAVGSGIGIRVDIDYFVIRLDIAVPIRKPYQLENDYWIFKNNDFWRDYIISLAVGYPF